MPPSFATADLYHSLVDNLPVCVIRKDRDGRFVFVNELFCQLLGRRSGDIIGRTDSDFYPLALAEKSVARATSSAPRRFSGT
jgi:PAS domain S-box-containing protein